MYSYDERIRAVKLYLKLGKRTGPTIRQLGYPSKNALKSWHWEYEQGRDLQLGYVRVKQKYSAAQKELAVQYFLEHGRCIASAIKVLGYPCRAILAAWIEELNPDGRKHITGRAANPRHAPEVKTAAVVELCTRQISAQAIAEKLAISRPTLYNWKNQLL